MTQVNLAELLSKVDTSKIIQGWSPYMKLGWKPLPLQLAFAILPQEEVLFGGALGPGKSEALLAAALQYTHRPGYAAMIYRKSYQDLVKPGALLERAIEWLTPHIGKGVSYNAQQHIFTFASGAKLGFGYMGRKGSRDTMQGTELHFCGVDECTQHTEGDVSYARTRLRRKASEDIPIRMRFTANPGGIGHWWVYKRFGLAKNPNWNPENPKSPMYIGTNPKRPFIPALLADNPYLDVPDYLRRLEGLDEVTKARLLAGDWGASPFGIFRPEWFERYVKRGEYYSHKGDVLNMKQFSKFATIDVAASAREGVGGRKFSGKAGEDPSSLSDYEPCWTVCAVWGIAHNKLFLLDVLRLQTEIPEVFKIMEMAEKKWGKLTFGVEKNGVGAGVAQGGARLGFRIEEIWTTQDKVINAYDAVNMANQGLIIIPEYDKNGDYPKEHPWLEEWEGEIFNWMGLKEETSDQVDTMSTAAKRVSHMCLRHAGTKLKPGTTIPRVRGIDRHGELSY